MPAPSRRHGKLSSLNEADHGRPAGLTLRAESGETAPADATIERYPEAARIAKAVAFIAGGIVLGTGCTIIPGPHMVVTFWALPLAGIFMARRTFRIDKRFSRINGTCPLCEKPIELRGGPIKASNWRVCPQCNKDLEIVAPEPAGSDMLE